MHLLKVLSVLLKKEARALSRWTGVATLVVSMITFFCYADGLFEGVSSEKLIWMLVSLVGLLVGNLLFVLSGERSIFQPEENDGT